MASPAAAAPALAADGPHLSNGDLGLAIHRVGASAAGRANALSKQLCALGAEDLVAQELSDLNAALKSKADFGRASSTERNAQFVMHGVNSLRVLLKGMDFTVDSCDMTHAEALAIVTSAPSRATTPAPEPAPKPEPAPEPAPGFLGRFRRGATVKVEAPKVVTPARRVSEPNAKPHIENFKTDLPYGTKGGTKSARMAVADAMKAKMKEDLDEIFGPSTSWTMPLTPEEQAAKDAKTARNQEVADAIMEEFNRMRIVT